MSTLGWAGRAGPQYRGGVLIGRTGEWAGIDTALAAARDAEGRVVLLRGEAGVGKTALLDRAAETSDFRVLRATGVEA